MNNLEQVQTDALIAAHLQEQQYHRDFDTIDRIAENQQNQNIADSHESRSQNTPRTRRNRANSNRNNSNRNNHRDDYFCFVNLDRLEPFILIFPLCMIGSINHYHKYQSQVCFQKNFGVYEVGFNILITLMLVVVTGYKKANGADWFTILANNNVLFLMIMLLSLFIWVGFGFQSFFRIKFLEWTSSQKDEEKCFSWLSNTLYFFWFFLYGFILCVIIIDSCVWGRNLFHTSMKTVEIKKEYFQFLEKAEKIADDLKNGVEMDPSEIREKPNLVCTVQLSLKHRSDTPYPNEVQDNEKLNSFEFKTKEEKYFLKLFVQKLGESFKDIQDVCPICQDEFSLEQDVVKHPMCSHIYHWECLKGWFKVKRCCPLCRQQTRTGIVWSLWNEVFRNAAGLEPEE